MKPSASQLAPTKGISSGPALTTTPAISSSSSPLASLFKGNSIRLRQAWQPAAAPQPQQQRQHLGSAHLQRHFPGPMSQFWTPKAARNTSAMTGIETIATKRRPHLQQGRQLGVPSLLAGLAQDHRGAGAERHQGDRRAGPDPKAMRSAAASAAAGPAMAPAGRSPPEPERSGRASGAARRMASLLRPSPRASMIVNRVSATNMAVQCEWGAGSVDLDQQPGTGPPPCLGYDFAG